MRGRLIAIAWLVLAVALAASFVGQVVGARVREDHFAQLADFTVETDPDVRGVLLTEAEAVLAGELARERPDKALLVRAFAVTVAKQGPAAEAWRVQVETRARSRIETELARRSPDQIVLREAWDVLALANPDLAPGLLERIAAVTGDHSARLAALREAVVDLVRLSGHPDGDDRLERVARARADLIGEGATRMNWAARESAPVTTLLNAAGAAALGHFNALLAPYRTQPPGERAADQPARLRAAWAQLKAMDLVAGDAETTAVYAAAVRRDRVPPVGVAFSVLMTGLLFGGLAVAFRRVARGPSPIDPMAETLENVEPIDLDTDAETLASKGRTTGADETHAD